MYLCIYLYIWLLKYNTNTRNLVVKVKNKRFQLFSHSLLHIDKEALTSHVGKMLISIW